MRVGIRELRDNLSQYIRRAESGERIEITAHGRTVAELAPPSSTRDRSMHPIDRLIEAGVARAAIESGDPLEHWPDIHLPPGTVKALIDADREEKY
ncbi:MAG: type II toxin-antitoxin system prevent-host-death family antitoxin [Bryobacteraceae bacterium]